MDPCRRNREEVVVCDPLPPRPPHIYTHFFGPHGSISFQIPKNLVIRNFFMSSKAFCRDNIVQRPAYTVTLATFLCRFRSITKQYFRKADGILVFYDVTMESSFINLKSWMTSIEVRHNADMTSKIMCTKRQVKYHVILLHVPFRS